MRQVLSKLGLPSLLVVLVGTLAFAQPKPLAFTFTATLSGENVLRPVETTGSGTVIAVLVGNELTVTGVFQDLGSNLLNIEGFPGARIGVAPAGEEAPETEKLTAEQSVFGNPEAMTLTAFTKTTRRAGTFSGVFTLTDGQIQALWEGLFYVQLYTGLNAGGELRGQLGSDDPIFRIYRAYLSALGDPDVVQDITAEDLVGIWKQREGAEDAFQLYGDGSWTYLETLAEAGEPADPSRTWVLEDNVHTSTTGGQCSGRYSWYEVLYEDGRRSSFAIEAGPCNPVGIRMEWVKVDAEGNRVPLRE